MAATTRTSVTLTNGVLAPSEATAANVNAAVEVPAVAQATTSVIPPTVPSVAAMVAVLDVKTKEALDALLVSTTCETRNAHWNAMLIEFLRHMEPWRPKLPKLGVHLFECYTALDKAPDTDRYWKRLVARATNESELSNVLAIVLKITDSSTLDELRRIPVWSRGANGVSFQCLYIELFKHANALSVAEMVEKAAATVSAPPADGKSVDAKGDAASVETTGKDATATTGRHVSACICGGPLVEITAGCFGCTLRANNVLDIAPSLRAPIDFLHVESGFDAKKVQKFLACVAPTV